MPLPLLAAAGIGAAVKGIGSLFGAKGANDAAKAAANNANAENAWKTKLATAQYDTEKMPYYEQGSKMRGWRDALMRGVMRNPNNGLSKLFAGWDDGKTTAYNAAQDTRSVVNPFAAAGPAPTLKPVSGGWASTIGTALSGLGAGAMEGVNLNSILKGVRG